MKSNIYWSAQVEGVPLEISLIFAGKLGFVNIFFIKNPLLWIHTVDKIV